jgi:hypothetical protein
MARTRIKQVKHPRSADPFTGRVHPSFRQDAPFLARWDFFRYSAVITSR